MKFLHLADLHLGKTIYGISLIESEDQRVWIERLLVRIRELRPDAIVIAGDIFDRSNPSGDAMLLLNYMLKELAQMEIPVMMIAGNHDSGERLTFGDFGLQLANIHIGGQLNPEIKCVTVRGNDGDSVNFWLLPYIFPALVAQKLEQDDIHDYDTAMRRLLNAQQIDFSRKNVLIAHQNVTADGVEAIRGGSESMIGGVGQIDYTAFDGFDYVALGHLHSGYHVGRKEVRYAGSPLCYHFDEVRQPAKGPLLVTIGEKEDGLCKVETSTIVIEPLHPMQNFEGSYDELRRLLESREESNEYIRIVLTDRRTSPEITEHFRLLASARGSRILEVDSVYEEQTGSSLHPHTAKDVSMLTLDQLFSDFYSSRKNGEAVGEKELEVLRYASGMTEANIKNIDPAGRAVNMDSQIDELVNFVRKMVKEDKP